MTLLQCRAVSGLDEVWWGQVQFDRQRAVTDMSQFGPKSRAWFDRFFPERQIYHRSGGMVRYVSLSPGKQALLALGAVGLAGWSIYTSVDWVVDNLQSSNRNTEVERLEAKYQRWLAEARAQSEAAQAQLAERSEAFERITADFERRHEVLRGLMEMAGGSNLTAGARTIERDGARLLMRASIDEAEPRASRALAAAEPELVQAVSFRQRMDNLEAEQVTALAELEDRVVERSEQVRGVLRVTGVSVQRLVGAAADEEMGGPLVPRDLVSYLRETGMDTAYARRVSQVAARVAESRRLQAVAEAAPLAEPVAVVHRQTSGYGPRVDPFTGTPDFHSGLDLAAFERAPVVATSPGTVSFAGVKSGYGYVVEIDHGHGFRTRYGHLRDIQVSRGERVAIGQRIGSMGSTGRSTGTHLHYEVWFRGRTVDPINFLRAGRYVHEQG
ncbi:MAG: peptidoglycan DD-metalloendopeptidase family protein [Hydrogenophilaceae bacterium]|nr:peptidoglycan DD-metalloendopeptidase family protein [Hydrogenophilaceae bacterium]